jgi:hypothetical protein
LTAQVKTAKNLFQADLGGAMTLSTVIKDTRAAVAGNPAAARVLVSADGTLTGVTEVGMRTGAHAFTVDEPARLGGGGTAPNPVQYALASLGSCQAITYRFWAEHLGIPLDKLRPGSCVALEVAGTGKTSPLRAATLSGPQGGCQGPGGMPGA